MSLTKSATPLIARVTDDKKMYKSYKYYKSYNAIIHIIDNQSSIDIKSVVTDKKDTYEELAGWPNQWNLFDEILNKNTYHSN